MRDKNTLTLIETLLIQLLEIPSETGEEVSIGDFIIEQLNERGFDVQRQFVEDERFNVVARKGKSDTWIVAHMDTVPGQIPIKVTSECIYGRGACDNKQSIAGAILTGEQLNDINLLFTVGEESNFVGAKKAQEEGIKGNFVIIQEPSRYKVLTGYRGVIAFKITAKGTSQHSSLDGNDSAIHKLIDVICRMKKNEWNAFNAGRICGGEVENIVADYAEADILVRPKTLEEYKLIKKALVNLNLKDICISIKNDVPPSKSDVPFPENIARGFSEMAFFKNSIEFGAGDIVNAHTDHEHIIRKDLNELPERLIAMINTANKKMFDKVNT